MVSTIFRYSVICSRTESLCSEAVHFLTSGFLGISDGFVVCPSRKPMSFLMRSVSTASPPSSRILVLWGRIGLSHDYVVCHDSEHARYFLASRCRPAL